MRSGILALVFAIAAMTVLPALAGFWDKGPNRGNGWGRGGNPSVGAPGPIAGAGLAFLGVGGGYLVLRYRNRKAGRPRQ